MRKIRNVLLLLFLAGVAFGFYRYLSQPRIEFAGFRDLAEGRVAVFRLCNVSFTPYSYLGFEESRPLYYFSTKEEYGWDPLRAWTSTVGVSWQEIPPLTTREVPIPAKDHSPIGPCRIGVHLVRGTLADMPMSDRPIAAFIHRIRSIFAGPGVEPDTTWSDVIADWKSAGGESPRR